MSENRNLFNISSNAFLRRGAWFGIFMKPQRFASPAKVGKRGTTDLFVGTRRIGAQHLADPMLMQLIPVHHGEIINFRIHAEAEELTIITSYGCIRFCFAEPSLILVKGENGLGLRLERDMEIHQMARRRGEKGWETSFGYVCSVVYNPIKGDIDMDAKWDYERLSTPYVRGEVKPGADGEFLLSIEETEAFGRIRDHYPTYEEALADAKADWEAFLEKQPLLAPEYSEDRKEAAYMTWSDLAGPAGLVLRPYIFMRSADPASSWQMCQNAIVLKNHLDLAVELLLNMLDRLAPSGQLPDFFTDSRGAYLMIKPPLQGWALELLMREHDLGKEVPREKLEMMYDGYSRFADWLFEYRAGTDGLITMEHGDESGSDDSAIFKTAIAIDAPQQSACTALLLEKLGDLAKILGKEDESSLWYEKSRLMIERLIARFWNGERFVAYDHWQPERVIDTESIQFYYTLILGKRLPQEIIDKMAADLEEGQGYLSYAGFTTENLSASPYTEVGAGRGKILPADNIIVTTGLYLAGKKDQARRAAKLYCDGLKTAGSFYYAGGFIGTWAAAAFQILANLYSNM
ncbi:MAG: hypothetical protein IKR59_10160 [Lachnospiraceae bacterium]|nr:hypothetical protein [Lachnospiraceae bacterium]